jgi:hypothetical protein
MWPADATGTLFGESVFLTAVHAESRYELVKLEQNPPEGISASPEDPKANMFVWNASIFDGLGQYDGGYASLPTTCRSFVGLAFLLALSDDATTLNNAHAGGIVCADASSCGSSSPRSIRKSPRGSNSCRRSPILTYAAWPAFGELSHRTNTLPVMQITKTDYRPRLGFRLPAPRQPVSIMNILKECQELLRHKPIPGMPWLGWKG